MLRLPQGCRERAQRYIRQCWHVPEYRYFSFRDASKQRVAEIAACDIRGDLDFAYQEARRHPRSQKRLEQVRQLTRELARVGRYLLDC